MGPHYPPEPQDPWRTTSRSPTLVKFWFAVLSRDLQVSGPQRSRTSDTRRTPMVTVRSLLPTLHLLVREKSRLPSRRSVSPISRLRLLLLPSSELLMDRRSSVTLTRNSLTLLLLTRPASPLFRLGLCCRCRSLPNFGPPRLGRFRRARKDREKLGRLGSRRSLS
jgi:hypothetical protein